MSISGTVNKPTGIEIARTVVRYRLALEAAHARITQAILVLEHPETSFPIPLDRLLSDAEQALRFGLVVEKDSTFEAEVA